MTEEDSQLTLPVDEAVDRIARRDGKDPVELKRRVREALSEKQGE